jgi:hypothetical protein
VDLELVQNSPSKGRPILPTGFQNCSDLVWDTDLSELIMKKEKVASDLNMM